MKAIRELKKDTSRMVLTADKEVSLVVMYTAEIQEESRRTTTTANIPTNSNWPHLKI